jgi:hypothetical protein
MPPLPRLPRWLRDSADLLAVALLPPPRRLATVFDRIEAMR